MKRPSRWLRFFTRLRRALRLAGFLLEQFRKVDAEPHSAAAFRLDLVGNEGIRTVRVWMCTNPGGPQVTMQKLRMELEAAKDEIDRLNRAAGG